MTNLVYSTKVRNNKSKGQSLLKCIMSKLKDMKANDDNKEQSDKKPKKLYCKHCKTRGHTANDCNKWDEEPCTHCGQFNHEAKDCWHKDKLKQDKGKGKGLCKHARNEEMNTMDSDSQLSVVIIEMPGDVAPSRITFDSSEHGQHFNFTDYDVTNYNGIDKRTLYHDWLANSATMLPPEQVAQLLPWYMQWSCDLVAEMHCRRLVQNKACCTVPPSLSHNCSCDAEWQCEPHNVCFIHDSCFCPGSGAFPSVKPPHTSLSSNHS